MFDFNKFINKIMSENKSFFVAIQDEKALILNDSTINIGTKECIKNEIYRLESEDYSRVPDIHKEFALPSVNGIHEFILRVIVKEDYESGEESISSVEFVEVDHLRSQEQQVKSLINRIKLIKYLQILDVISLNENKTKPYSEYSYSTTISINEFYELNQQNKDYRIQDIELFNDDLMVSFKY